VFEKVYTFFCSFSPAAGAQARGAGVQKLQFMSALSQKCFIPNLERFINLKVVIKKLITGLFGPAHIAKYLLLLAL
jgi:hypothetical protein